MGARALLERREPHVEAAAAGQQLQQRAVDPVDDGAVVLARAVEPGPVLAAPRGEQVVADHPAERVQQRQRVGERRERAVGHVHPHVALGGEQRAEDLPGQPGRDPVGVQALERHVPLGLAQRLPDRLPEQHRLAGVGELLRQRLGQQLRADPQQPLGELGELGAAGARTGRRSRPPPRRAGRTWSAPGRSGRGWPPPRRSAGCRRRWRCRRGTPCPPGSRRCPTAGSPRGPDRTRARRGAPPRPGPGRARAPSSRPSGSAAAGSSRGRACGRARRTHRARCGPARRCRRRARGRTAARAARACWPARPSS